MTRHLLVWTEKVEYSEDIIAKKNRIINLSNTILGNKIYLLESDHMGFYQQAEYDWHDSNFLLIFRQLNTIQFIEFACELLRADYIEIDFLNEALVLEGASFRFVKQEGGYTIEVFNIEQIEEADTSEEHPNIRLLISRMETCLEKDDYSGVLHSSASVYETMAKSIVGIPTIQDQTLKSFFDRYKLDSQLPMPILEFILETYDKRNVTPLAGHGSLQVPTITKEQAIVLSEMTKTIVRIQGKIKREV